MTNVLIVDDSPTLRHLIRSILESDPDINVIGEAMNGKEAVDKCKRLSPDIITMDIRMPHMDGFQATEQIMSEVPKPILVLTSTMSDRELSITYKAIESGALMVVSKPKISKCLQTDAEHLVSTVKALADVNVLKRKARQLPVIPPPIPGLRMKKNEDIGIIAICASTGGPPVIQSILSGLQADFPIPIVIVQHISNGFTTSMVKWLDETVPLSVKEAENHEYLEAGTVYFAPDNTHLKISSVKTVHLVETPKIQGHRPSGTVLFNSVAHQYRRRGVGVLLTGMGSDGAEGLKALHNAGGYTIVQDEPSCIVFGMPQKAMELGAADDILPPDEITARLKQLFDSSSKPQASSDERGSGRILNS